jgi:D-xylose transport system substrate-binding protein
MNHIRRSLIVALALGAAVCSLIVAGCGGDDGSSTAPASADATAGQSTTGSSASGTVDLLLPTSETVRFVRQDEPNIIASLKKLAPDVDVKVLNAEGDAQQQVTQMETALSNGAAGVILTAVDPSGAGGMIARAKADGVPVVTYVHDITSGDPDYHVTIPFSDLGSVHGKKIAEDVAQRDEPLRLALMYGDPSYVTERQLEDAYSKELRPLIDQGKVKVVCQAAAKDFAPAEAQRNMEQCLTKTGDQLDAVVAVNDDMAGGVAAALSADDLLGKVKIYGGYDATLEGLRRVIAGQQVQDLRPPFKEMADAAAQLIVSAIEGTDPPAGLVNGRLKDGTVTIGSGDGIPTAVMKNTPVTLDNLQETVIDAGIFTKQELCSGGAAAKSKFCTT